nr:hypothetical protein [Haliscomenobacter sp.]
MIFHFTLPGGGCVDGIRLFNNGSDPNSAAPGMGAGDYSNTVSDGTGTERYVNNFANNGTLCTEASISCGCYNVTVTLDANCQFKLTRNLVSDGNSCTGAYVRVMDNNPTNNDVIDCAGVWTYGLFNPMAPSFAGVKSPLKTKLHLP